MMKTKKTSQTKIAMAIVAGIIVIILALFVEIVSSQEDGWARLAGHFYPGDHITLNMSIKIDDFDISLSDAKITCDFNGDEQNISVDSQTIKTHGGDYGCYCYHIIIPADLLNREEDLAFNVEYMNANNWYIVTHNCDIVLTNTENSYTGSMDVASEFNNGRKETLTCEFEPDDDGTLSVMWGL